MKVFILSITIAFFAISVEAQDNFSRSIPVQKGQEINMHFDYPELVKVSTWDKNEIQVTGSVNINGGENDDAFELTHTTSGNQVNVVAKLHDVHSLPQRVTVYHNGQKMIFKDKAALKKYQAENGKNFTSMNIGPQIEITLDVKVPRNTNTTIASVYGFVEIKSFEGPLAVEATYGGVDAALPEKSVGEIVAETNYGQIYTNFDSKFGGEGSQGDFHTTVSAKPGAGPKYSFESKYGNVYIRKLVN